MTVKSKSFTSSQEIGYPRVLTLTSQVSSEFSVISIRNTDWRPQRYLLLGDCIKIPN